MPKKKKKDKTPKPRNIWEINPKTRVKPSDKQYDRQNNKKKKRSWVNNVHWFGE